MAATDSDRPGSEVGMGFTYEKPMRVALSKELTPEECKQLSRLLMRYMDYLMACDDMNRALLQDYHSDRIKYNVLDEHQKKGTKTQFDHARKILDRLTNIIGGRM